MGVKALLWRGEDSYTAEKIQKAFHWAIHYRCVESLSLFLDRDVDILETVDSKFITMASVEKAMGYSLEVEYNGLMHVILTKNIDLLKALWEGVESIDFCINPPLGEFHGVLYAVVESPK